MSDYSNAHKYEYNMVIGHTLLYEWFECLRKDLRDGRTIRWLDRLEVLKKSKAQSQLSCKEKEE